MKQLIIIIATLLLNSTVFAAATPSHQIDGVWEVRYDASNTPSSHIRITTQKNGELIGVIEEAYPRPGENPSPNCTKCEGANKDKPIVGMTVLWGMMPDGTNQWSQGHVLNAENGKIYSGKMTLSKDGKTLDLRGYVFQPVFGATSTWHKIK